MEKRNIFVIKFLSAVIIFAVIIFALINFTQKNIEQYIIEHTKSDLKHIVKSSTYLLEAAISRYYYGMQLISKDKYLAEMLWKSASNQKTNIDISTIDLYYKTNKNDIEALFLLDANGILLHKNISETKNSLSPERNYNDTQNINFVLKEQKYFKGIYSTDRKISTDGRIKYFVELMEPIFYGNRFVGIIRCLLSMDTLFENYVYKLSRGNNGYFYIVGNKFILVKHSESNPDDNFLKSLQRAELLALKGLDYKFFFEKFVNSNNAGGKHITEIGHVNVSMDDNSWTIGLFTPCNKIAGFMKSTTRNLILSAFLVWFFGAGILFFFIKKKLYIAETTSILKDSEKRFRALAELLPQTVFEADNNGILTFFNHATITTFGYSENELKNNFPAPQLVINKQRDKLIENNRKMLMNGKKIKYGNEYTGLKKDGTKFPVAVYSNIIEHNGQIEGTRGIVIDLTQIKERERKIKENEKFYNDTLNCLLTEISVLKPDGEVVFINNIPLEVGDISAKDVVGKKFYDLLWFREIKELIKGDIKSCVQGETIVRDIELEHSNGKKRWIEFSIHPVYDLYGKVKYLVPEGRNINARKKAEQSLKEREHNFLSFFELSPQATALTTAKKGKILFANKMFCNISKYSKEELIGKTTVECNFYSGFAREEMVDQLDTTGEINGLECEICVKDGTKIDVLIFSKYIEINRKRHIITIFIDMTKHKYLEAQLQHAEKMETIGTLAGGIAHDFNNLLMGIQGNASLLLLEAEATDLNYVKLKNIEQYVQDGGNLTRQLLNFARGGRYEVKLTDINELIGKSATMFGRTKKQIVIEKSLQKKLWMAEVDQGQIEQILLNLYINAWHAMPGGGTLYIKTNNIKITKSSVRSYKLQPGSYVMISIRDTGTGMDKPTLKRIFEPFFTTKEMGRGSGLGLASVYGIVTNHSGIINVYSKVGKGTTFIIYLPSTLKKSNQESSVDIDVIKGKGTILIVDDEEMVIDVGRQMLKALGYKVLVAQNGNEAVKIYKKENDKIDLVILDMIMPKLSGAKTFELFKKINKEVKVLLSSGYSLNEQAMQILDKGCNGFISKPFNLKQLSFQITEILSSE